MLSNTVLCILLLSCTIIYGEVLFTENFDNGYSQWSLTGPSGSVTSDTLHYISGKSIRLRDNTALTRAISTVGKTDVYIKYSMAAGVLENNDWCYFEVSTNGGQSFQKILSLTNGDDDNIFNVGVYQHNSLDNNANLQIRYRVVGSGADNCYLEDTEVYTLSGRSYLTKDDLLSGNDAGDIIPTFAFMPTSEATTATNTFEGILSLTPTSGSIDIIVDTYDGLSQTGVNVLPSFSISFVQSNGNLIPKEQGRVTTSHARWEYVVGFGKVWNEPGDGTYSRAAFPFTLIQKNSNCVHNGMMSFLFSGSSVSYLSYQIASETCLYAKANFWGMINPTYIPGSVSGKTTIINEFNAEIAGRIPTYDIADIGTHYPGTNPTSFASEISAAHLSATGVFYDNKHFVNLPQTRGGPYPFPDSLILPSYSTAKSSGAALALMRIQQKYPEDNIFGTSVGSLVPECALSKWSEVKLNDLTDMATGLYASSIYMRDETNSDSTSNSWFLKLTHSEKIGWACNTYNKKTQPQNLWVYHTTDIYILADALDNYLMAKEGKSYYEFLNDEVYGPNGQSKMMMNSGLSTYDSASKPFGGFGLFYTRDDVAKLARLFQTGGMIGTTQVLDATQVSRSLQKDPSDTGIAVQSSSETYNYNNGFWAKFVSLPGCSSNKYVPIMSGYGGITVAILPNGVNYYYFSDNDEFSWQTSAGATSTINAFC